MACLLAMPVYLFWLSGNARKRRITEAFALVPLAIPPFAAVASWMTLLAWTPESGRLVWGAESPLQAWLYSLPGCAAVLACCYWPIVFFMLILAGSPPRTSLEAARLYLPTRQRILSIWLPSALEAAAPAALLVSCLAALQFEAPGLLSVDVYPMDVFVRFSALMDERAAVWLCAPYALAGALGVWAGMRLLFLCDAASEAPPVIQLSSSLNYSLVIPVALIACASILVPLAALSLHAFSYDALAEWTRQAPTVLRSLGYAFAATLVILTIGFAMTDPRRKRPDWLTLALAMALFAMPGALIASGWLRLRAFWPGWLPWWAQTATLFAAYAAHYWAAGLIAARWAWKRYGQAQREADECLPLDWTTRNLRLRLSSFAGTLPPAAYAIGALIWTNVSITLLLHPPGGETLALQYYNLLHYGSEPRTAAIGLLLLLVPPIFLLGTGALVISWRRA